MSHIIVSFTFDLILCFFLLQEYPSRLSSSDTTVKLPLPHLVAHFVQKKNLKNFCLKKLKIICIKLFSLQSLDNECPPSFRVPSFLIVINESENVSEREKVKEEKVKVRANAEIFSRICEIHQNVMQINKTKDFSIEFPFVRMKVILMQNNA